MKLLVNLDPVTAGMSGIGRYTLMLAGALLRTNRLETICAIRAGKILPEPQVSRLLDPVNYTAAKPSGLTRRLRQTAALIPGSRSAQARFNAQRARSALQSLQGYTYWEPGYTLLPFAGPSLLTLYDLSHRDHPEFHPRSRVIQLNKDLPDSIARASALLTVSEYSRQQIQRVFSPDKPVEVAYPGVDTAFFEVDEPAIARGRQSLALPHRYMLSLATFEPRKNLDRVLDAYLSLPESLRRSYPLVLAGCSGWNNSHLDRRLKQLQYSGEIRVLGYVAQPLLPALYAGASLCIYTSLYEGFGMPIVEAMASGTPVITSDRTSMPEVSGSAALLVNPESSAEISAAMATLINNPEERTQRRQLGQQQARQFSWDTSAGHLLRVLEQCQERAS